MNFKLILFLILCSIVFCLISYQYIGNILTRVLGIDVIIINYLPTNYTNIEVTVAEKKTGIKNKLMDYKNITHVIKSSHISDWIQQMEEKYSKENERIKKVCNEYRKNYQTKLGLQRQSVIRRNIIKNMMLDTKHRLAYCRHGKVGTTTLLSHFSDLTEDLPTNLRDMLKKNDESAYKILHNIIPTKFKVSDTILMEDIDNKTSNNELFIETFKEFLSAHRIMAFSFVRHPFERLASAYVDKVLEADYLQSKYGISDIHTFSEFVNHVLAQYKQSGCYKSYDTPCFDIDVHWRPFNARCSYCDIPYHMIGRVETFGDDIKYILLKQNLTSDISLSSSDLHTHKSAKLSQGLNSEETQGDTAASRGEMYFSELDEKQIDNLYEMYSFDLELFDYKVEKYIFNKN